MPIYGGQLNGTFAGQIVGRGQSQNATINTLTNYHKRVSTGGVYQSSGSTTHFLNYSRWWWGTGNMHIHLYENLYGPNSDYGHFLVNGHTRSGNPSIATIYNQGVPTPYATNYNGTYERCEIKFDSSSYYTYNIMIECYNMLYSTSSAVGPHGGAGSNTWHMFGSTEVIG